jgi:RimJ/RimL family protein N-acetyltransferase
VASFADKPTIEGERIVLRPLVAADAAALPADLDDLEARRLTGTHREFSPADVERWATGRSDGDSRIDLAIVERATGSGRARGLGVQPAGDPRLRTDQLPPRRRSA